MLHAYLGRAEDNDAYCECQNEPAGLIMSDREPPANQSSQQAQEVEGGGVGSLPHTNVQWTHDPQMIRTIHRNHCPPSFLGPGMAPVIVPFTPLAEDSDIFRHILYSDIVAPNIAAHEKGAYVHLSLWFCLC
jgi:hypothetical protein